MRNEYINFQQDKKMTKKIVSIISIIFCLMITALFLSGCGGGGDDPPPTTTTPPPVTVPTSHAPVISNLQYSPQTATQNQGNGTVTIIGTINFTDQGGDVKTAVVNRYNAQGVLLGTGTGPLSNLSGVTSGSTTAAGDISTANVGVFTIEVYVIDAVGNSSNKLTGAFTVTAPAASDTLIGNFKFVFKIIDTSTDRITLDTKSSQKTSEGEYYYTGYNATYPAVTARGAWSNSLSKYLIVATRTYSAFADAYQFTINTDNTLSGCFMISSDSGVTWSNCYSFIIPESHKSPLGSWEMSMESQNDPIDINDFYEIRMAEDLEAQAQRTEYASPVDSELVSKINELMAIIGNHR
ncbi:MAG: hypothetical protein Q8K00_00515 [Syntrophales bacterium]|nr:hypothetical protein [Syntrophales bacterium]